MNKRIIELADKAVEDISSGPWNISDEFCIKFAQLIVRECANIAEDIQTFYDKNNDSVVNTEIWTMIKLHFGVEE